MHGAVARAASFLCLFLAVVVRTERQVYILSENLEQVVTSSTLEWVQYNARSHVLLKNAVVAAYQLKQEPNVTEEVDPKSGEDAFMKLPIYVCRTKLAAIWVPGQLRKGDDFCVVSLYRKVSRERHFEVLINKEKRSRLSWAQKSKYTITPQGSVEGSDKIYVARRPVKYNRKEGALTHTVGNFNPQENLGVFSLVDQNDNELKFEDGEILVESEPTRYEFKHVKFDKIKSKHRHSPQVLGDVVLKNEGGQGIQKVVSVLSYNYTHYTNWGKEHGLLIALPFAVDLPNGSKFNGKWSFAESTPKTDVVPIERYLDEGTAVNVTLKGNYTESDVPYVATVTAFYKDNDTLESILRDSLVMKRMTGVVQEFSAVYFLNNNTLVPTTTTTARTTTSITTQTTQSQTVTVNVHNTEDIYTVEEKSEKPISNEVPHDVPPELDNSVQQLTKKVDSSGERRLISSCTVLIFALLFMQLA